MHGKAHCPEAPRSLLIVVAIILFGCTVSTPGHVIALESCAECYELIVWPGSEAECYHSFEEDPEAAGVFRLCDGTVELQSGGSGHADCHDLMEEGDCGTHDLCGSLAVAADVSALIAALRAIEPSREAADALAGHVFLGSHVEFIRDQRTIRVLDCKGAALLTEKLEPQSLRVLSQSMRAFLYPIA